MNKKKKTKRKKKSRETSQKHKSFLSRPQHFMTYIPISDGPYMVYIYFDTFVYCASFSNFFFFDFVFVFVVNKFKIAPNWQLRHSICMRGVRGTLDRQRRRGKTFLTWSASRGAPSRYTLLTPYSIHFAQEHFSTCCDINRCVSHFQNTLRDCPTTPNFFFTSTLPLPPSPLPWCNVHYLLLRVGEVDMIGICKRPQMLHGLRGRSRLAANCFTIINCPTD